MSILEESWWGFSPEHGWVVLDRSIECNKPGSGKLLFFRCSDEVVYPEDRKRWNSPHYVFAPRYIESLPMAEQNASEAKLEMLKLKWSEYHDKIAREGKALEERNLQAARGRFFAKLGRDDPGLRPATNRVHRSPHCYSCRHPLDSSANFECIECRWLVCVCGACGCGYFGP